MTKTCVICKKQPIPGDFTRSFHKFPKNIELKQKWMEIIGIKDITKVSTVCSYHFRDDSYHQTDGYTKIRRLLSTAVPVPALYGKISVLEQITDDIVTPSSIEACSVDINEYTFSSNSLDSSRNSNNAVSDSSTKVSTSNCVDESRGSQDLVTGIVCDSDLFFTQPKSTETTSDDIGVDSKRKQSTNESTLLKKKFRFMNGCQPTHVSREDFISDEAWGRFIKLMRYKNRQITAAKKRNTRREKQLYNIKKLVKSLRDRNKLAAAEYLEVIF